MTTRMVTHNDRRSWLRAVWFALDGYREACIPPSTDSSPQPAYDAEWDEICTAMAWIAEELGKDSSDDFTA